MVFAIQWHESAMDLHVFPIPILPPPSPSHPSGSSQCTSPEHLSHASNLGWWSVSPLVVYTCFNAVLSEYPTLAFSHRVPKSVLYICISFSVLHIGLLLPSFKIPYICVSILYWSLSFWLTSLYIMGSSFITALFIIARTWKQSRCPSAEEWIRKLWYIYTMEYYSAIKNNSSILSWKIPWIDKPGGLQSMEVQSWTWLSNWAHKRKSVVMFVRLRPSFIPSMCFMPSYHHLSEHLSHLEYTLSNHPSSSNCLSAQTPPIL